MVEIAKGLPIFELQNSKDSSSEQQTVAENEILFTLKDSFEDEIDWYDI